MGVHTLVAIANVVNKNLSILGAGAVWDSYPLAVVMSLLCSCLFPGTRLPQWMTCRPTFAVSCIATGTGNSLTWPGVPYIYSV